MQAPNVVNTNAFVFWIRALRLLLHIAAGLALSAFYVPFCAETRKKTLIHWWSAKLIAILNIQVIVHGDTTSLHNEPSGMLLVANHISWIDIFALMSYTPLRFVAKSEIQQWPLFGYLASKGNVLFIDRSKRQEAKRMTNALLHHLNAGERLCYFPEGTTTNGTHLLPFKGSLLQAAINADAHIQPVAVFYPLNNRAANTLMAYAGETTMLESMLNILRQRAPVAELTFFTPIDTSNTSHEQRDRRVIADQIQQQIQQYLYGK